MRRAASFSASDSARCGSAIMTRLPRSRRSALVLLLKRRTAAPLSGCRFVFRFCALDAALDQRLDRGNRDPPRITNAQRVKFTSVQEIVELLMRDTEHLLGSPRRDK